jgi:hypothetical protein
MSGSLENLKDIQFNIGGSRLTESVLNPKIRSTANITNLQSVVGLPLHSARIMSSSGFSSVGSGPLTFRTRGGVKAKV